MSRMDLRPLPVRSDKQSSRPVQSGSFVGVIQILRVSPDPFRVELLVKSSIVEGDLWVTDISGMKENRTMESSSSRVL